MILKRKFAALGLASAVLLSSVPAFAGTISERTLTGTNASTGNVVLGNGNHVLNATGTSGSGTATVKKVVAYFPDSTVATVKVTSPNNGTNSFQAVATTEGANQSYYINWRGSSSTASAKFL